MSHPSARQAEAEADLVPGSALSARLYDPVLWWGERSGLSRKRKRLLAEAVGSVIEIGAGTGLNLDHYDADRVEELILVEPERHKAAILREKVERTGLEAEVVRAPASMLPFGDEVFDTAVVTLCLCTVPDPAESAREIGRVLKPDGVLLFMEHVRSGRPWLGAIQDRLRAPWARLADGCQCNRRTVEMLRAEGWEVEVTHVADGPLMPPVARPIVTGRASRRRSIEAGG